MTMIRKLIRADITELGEDEVEVVMSTSSLARDGHVLVPQGAQIENYRANPIVLWSHDPDKPIGNSENVQVSSDKITARVKFAPLGISKKADEIRGLVKSGVIRAVSIGFDPLEGEPLDPLKPKGGQRFTIWEMLEMSFVSVPADTGAVVTARAHGDTDMPTAQAPAPTGKTRATKPKHRALRFAVVGADGPMQRGLYDVASLCYTFESLGWQVDHAKMEAAIEGDASAVPGMLAAVLQDLGDALIAMTEEEVAEALAGRDIELDDDDDDDEFPEGDRTHIRAGSTAAVRSFRRGMARARIRAGKALSKETVRCLRDARDLHDEAMDLHRSAMRKHREGMATIDDMLDRAGVSDPDSTSTQTVQTSDGTDVSDGSSSGRGAGDADWRKRQAEMMAFSRSA